MADARVRACALLSLRSVDPRGHALGQRRGPMGYTVCKHARALTQAGRLWGGFRAAAFGIFTDARGS